MGVGGLFLLVAAGVPAFGRLDLLFGVEVPLTALLSSSESPFSGTVTVVAFPRRRVGFWEVGD